MCTDVPGVMVSRKLFMIVEVSIQLDGHDV